MAFRHAISLLVHEQIAVVVDQCLNFETFASAALIMIHVSPAASFAREALIEALKQAGCVRSMVNPISVRSVWGALTEAHLANVRALRAHCDANTIVSFHASNDMLLRSLPDFAPGTAPLFDELAVTPESTWFTGRQFGQSAAFAALLDRMGCRSGCGSQIEGASYPYGMLSDLAATLEGESKLLAALPSASEEIVFSTWARCRVGPPGGVPYVLFRSSGLLAAGAAILPGALRSTWVGDVLQKGLNRIELRLSSPYARPADVEDLIAGRNPKGVAPTASGEPAHYGIKRIARTYDDPLRERIRRHTLAQVVAA